MRTLLGRSFLQVDALTRYSAAELGDFIEAANQVVGEWSRKSPALVVVKKKAASVRGVNCLI